ncbi:hypothetical protein [Metallosphaera hakonensis]|uniref:Uncharacterized protein n=2 Tax=Metallosphaera hakonensis TaxID=79601 RepID=A0A2U9IWZ3_9CREN|nr:hypothetical protein [Metallosphaera hakonensis]AWS00513.1 hypothetical protein DFR87_03175 [Metallosphaera hakonensis JCM 8857 = DSM 7519]
MKDWQVAGVSLLLILLPVLPALADNFPAFLGASIVGFGIAVYFFWTYKPWANKDNAVVSLYFTGIFSFGLALAVFLVLPLHPRPYGIVSIVESVPFFISFYFATKTIWRGLFKRDILYLADGYFAFVLTILIGAIIGRFLHNFYELIVLYTGFLTMGFILMFYFRK